MEGRSQANLTNQCAMLVSPPCAFSGLTLIGIGVGLEGLTHLVWTHSGKSCHKLTHLLLCLNVTQAAKGAFPHPCRMGITPHFLQAFLSVVGRLTLPVFPLPPSRVVILARMALFRFSWSLGE